ncbi:MULTISPECIES: DsrE family protein [unclassified Thioalkalivibrio]|uniref:DsrE family protein n=1 Tax=unclassified Thioalkalivibrio TaxID=2621013 RepID=UPI000360EBE3|nr:MULTISPECIES: DsrE family protein [unclassified Thioalkalivibrio]
MNPLSFLARPGWFLAGALFVLSLGVTWALFSFERDGGETADADDTLQVVYHINADDPALHLNALRNLQNHIDGSTVDRLEIKVVMHGGGVSLLQHAKDDPDLRSTVDTLKMQDVRFLVCGNTLDKRGIELDDLHDAEPKDRVSSGIGELTRLQRAGYTYIKP